MPELPRKLFVFDTAWNSPYGMYLAEMLEQEFQGRVEVVITVPADDDAEPDSVGVRRIVPRRRRTGLRDSLRLVSAPARCAVEAWRSRGVVLLTTGGYHHYWIMGLAAAIGLPVVYVVHNPGSDRVWSGTHVSERFLARNSIVVVHNQTAVEPLARELGARVVAARHPLYTEWAKQWLTRAPSGRAAIMLGGLRPDKGSGDIERILRVFHEKGRRAKLIIAGGGTPPALPSRYDEVGDLRIGDPYLPEADMAEAIMESSVLVAPYRDVTFSATIGLALACGLGVVTYHSEALMHLVSARGMVPEGDAESLAERALEYLDSPWANPVQPDQWNVESAREWAVAVAEAWRVRKRWRGPR